MSLPHENTHICPKCGSKDIFVIDGHADAYDAGNNIPYDPTIFIYIPVDRYICGACGWAIPRQASTLASSGP